MVILIGYLYSYAGFSLVSLLLYPVRTIKIKVKFIGNCQPTRNFTSLV